MEKISINFRVNEIELLNTFSWRKKIIDRAIKIEILDKSSGQEHPKGFRLIIYILPVQHQSIGMRLSIEY